MSLEQIKLRRFGIRPQNRITEKRAPQLISAIFWARVPRQMTGGRERDALAISPHLANGSDGNRGGNRWHAASPQELQRLRLSQIVKSPADGQRHEKADAASKQELVPFDPGLTGEKP